MSRKANSQKKKRTKHYTGQDAAVRGTKVTRVSAPDRSKFGEWFNDNRKRLAGWGILIGGSLIIYFLLSLLLRWIF